MPATSCNDAATALAGTTPCAPNVPPELAAAHPDGVDAWPPHGVRPPRPIRWSLAYRWEGGPEQLLADPPPRVLVGSGSDCTLRLDGPDVADQHCLLVLGAERAAVRALQALVLVNGQPMVESPLEAGDVLRLGPYQVVLKAERPPQAEVESPNAPPAVAEPACGPLAELEAELAATASQHAARTEDLERSGRCTGQPLATGQRTAQVDWIARAEALLQHASEMTAFLAEIEARRADSQQAIEQIERERTRLAELEINLAQRARELVEREQQQRQLESELHRREQGWLRAQAAVQARLHAEQEQLRLRAEELEAARQALDRDSDARLQELADLRRGLDAARAELETAQSELSRQRQEFDAAQQDLCERQQKLHQEAQELAASRQALQAAQAQLESMREVWLAEHMMAQGRLAEEEQRLHVLAGELEAARQALARSHEHQRAEAAAARRQLQDLSERLEAERQELLARERRLRADEAELAEARAALESDRAVCAERQAALEQSRVALEQLRQTWLAEHRDAQARLAEREQRLRLQIAEQQAAREALAASTEQQRRVLEVRLHDAELQALQAEQRLAELRVQEEQLQARQAKLAEQCQQCDARLHEVAQREAALAQEREAFQTAQRHWQAQQDQVAADLAASQAELDAKSAQLSQLQAQLDSLAMQLQERQTRLQIQEAKLAEQQAQLQSQQELLAHQQAEFDSKRSRLEEQCAALEAERARLAQQQIAFQAEQQRLARQQEEFNSKRSRLEEQCAALEAERARLAEEQACLQQQWASLHEAQQRAVQHQAPGVQGTPQPDAGCDHADLAATAAEMAAEREELEASLAALKRTETELAAQREQIEAAQAKLQRAQQQLDERCQELEARAAEIQAAREQLDRQRAEWAAQQAQEQEELAAARRGLEAAQREARLRARLLSADEEEETSVAGGSPVPLEQESSTSVAASGYTGAGASSYESWKRHILAQEDADEEPAEPAPYRTEPSRQQDQRQQAAESEAEEDESLSHYLSQFWKRISSQQPAADARAGVPHESLPTRQPAANEAAAAAPPAPTAPERSNRRSTPRQPAPERATDLSVLREVALHNARQAISAHERRRLRRWQQVKLAVAGVGLGLGSAEILLPNHALGSPALGLACVMLGSLALTWWVATSVRISRKLLGERQQIRAIGAEGDEMACLGDRARAPQAEGGGVRAAGRAEQPGAPQHTGHEASPSDGSAHTVGTLCPEQPAPPLQGQD